MNKVTGFLGKENPLLVTSYTLVLACANLLSQDGCRVSVYSWGWSCQVWGRLSSRAHVTFQMVSNTGYSFERHLTRNVP